MTIRLYLEDPFRRSFEARIVATRDSPAGPQVALDCTCFYPEGGGQPADQGTLSGVAVVDVQEEGGLVWHLLAEPLQATTVQGQVDWARRFDHMQQHTGQHILSQVLLSRLGAETVSFHLGAELATIDLDRTDLSAAELEAVEDEVNRLVTDDLPVRSYFVSPEDLPRLNLRKPPPKAERIRIVEVVGVDLSACGGTHVRSTGQIGLVKVRRLERYKGGTRLEFLCGRRALCDYRWKHQALSVLARQLTVGDREVEAAVRRLLESEREVRHRAESLCRELLVHQAAALRQSALPAGRFQVVVRAFPERPPAEVKQLAAILTSEPGTVALLATLNPSVRLFFARSGDVEALDARQLLRSVTERFGGGGGGRPEAAEGGGMAAERAAEALAWAAHEAQTRLTQGGVVW